MANIINLSELRAAMVKVKDYTDTYGGKIDKITLNGVEQPVTNKTVALTVITNAVDDLVNYYKKSETYTQTEVDNLVSTIPKFAIKVVAALPTEDISTTTVYLLKTSETETGNLYTEYIYVDNKWEELGTQKLDLSDYVTNTDLATALADYTLTTDLNTALDGKVDKVTGKGLSTEDFTAALKTKLEGLTNYDDTELRGLIAAKQDSLTPGEAITITNNTIAATTATNSTLGVVKGSTTNYKGSIASDGTIEINNLTTKISAIDTALDGKVDEETGKGLSTNDYTTTEKNKLAGIEDSAEVNVIETVKVNGAALTPDSNKAVDVEVSTIEYGTQSQALFYTADDQTNEIASLGLGTNSVSIGVRPTSVSTAMEYKTVPEVGYVDNAVSNLQSQIDALGEPFRVKSWDASNLTVNIPTCTTDIANTSIDKMVFKISGQEATDYQIVGMIAYQVQDSSANRINCWPVCQFTGQNQTELSVRWMCGGTTVKVATKVQAWVLLKHR